MTGNFDDDALKLVWRNVAVSVLVEIVECLAQTLPLVSLDELGEFVVYISGVRA